MVLKDSDLSSPEKQLHMSFKQEKNRLNFLKIVFYVLFILCLALSLFSWHTWKQTDSKTLLAIMACCILTKIGSILGIVGSFSSIQDLKHQKDISSEVKTGPGHHILVVSFYFLILVLIAFVIFGTRALFYSDRAIAYLDAKFNSDSEEWFLRYGDLSLEDMENWSLLMTNVVGYTCYIIVFLILIITYLLMGIALKYGIISSVLSLINLGLLVLTWGIVYLIIYADVFRQQMDFYIPISLIISAIALAVALCIVSVLGYIIAVTEKVSLIKSYIILCLIACSIAGMSTFLSTSVSRNFVTSLGYQCYDFMAMVDEQYINNLGCGEKYVNISTSQEFGCSKGQQRYIWEHRGDYGCLNSLCCEIFITDSKAKFDYLGICSASCIILIFISVWCSLNFYYKEDCEVVENQSKGHMKILIALLLVSVAWVYFISFHLPPVPATVPYKKAGVVVTNGAFVDPRLMHEGFCLVLDPLDIQVEKCDECTKSEYSLTGEGKTILRTDSYDSQNTNENSFIFTDQDFDKIREVYNKLKLCPPCENAKFALNLNRTNFLKSGETEEITILSTILEFPVSQETITLTGKAKSLKKNEEVEIVLSGHCITYETKAKYGEFSIKVPPPFYNIPYTLNLTYNSPSATTNRIIQIGGILSSYQTIEPTTLYSSSSTYKVTFSFIFHESKQSDFSIEVRKGYNNFSGPYIQASQVLQLESGVYSFLASAIGFKSDMREIFIDSDMNIAFFLIPDKIEDNEVRIILSWQGESALDLRSSFVMNKDIDCEVSHINRVCGGVRVSNISDFGRYGFEEMRIRPLGAYQYFFYTFQEKQAFYMADLKVYIKSEIMPVVRFGLGSRFMWDVPKNPEFRIWAGFCLDGIVGLTSLQPLKAYVSDIDLNNVRNVCREFYGEPNIYDADHSFTVNANRGYNIPMNITRFR